MKKQKNYLLEDFLNDPEADVGTGLLVTRGYGFCFTLKQPQRWRKTKEGIPILPFGGIGGKLEKNELPSESLQRETKEEVDSDIKLIDPEKVFLIKKGEIEEISLSTRIKGEPLPWIIYKRPREEIGRKPFTYILIYAGKFLSKNIFPLDDPAILEMSFNLLCHIMERSTSIEEFQRMGGKITSKIVLPAKSILRPIGTAEALYLCAKKKRKFLNQISKGLNLK